MLTIPTVSVTLGSGLKLDRDFWLVDSCHQSAQGERYPQQKNFSTVLKSLRSLLVKIQNERCYFTFGGFLIDFLN